MNADQDPELKSGHRRIRSFVRREGRLTEAQKRALQDLLPRYSVRLTDGMIDKSATFGREAPLVIEIGFGNGQALVQMASCSPDRDFIGIEVHRPGVGNCLLQIEQQQLSNVRVMIDDATDILREHVRSHSLDAVHTFFPDAWHKQRNHKRRILQFPFVQLLADRICHGGTLQLATDWQNYAEHMQTVVKQVPEFENQAGAGQFSPRPE